MRVRKDGCPGAHALRLHSKVEEGVSIGIKMSWHHLGFPSRRRPRLWDWGGTAGEAGQREEGLRNSRQPLNDHLTSN